jgi:branched-chain amino acid transport system permease protein
MRLLASILIDGVAYGMILFMISVGLSVTMGLMRVVNLAHGAFAMLGGFTAHWLTMRLGIRFEFALVAGVAVTMLVALPLDLFFYRRIYALGDLEQVLLTIGLVFIAIATATVLFGTEVRPIRLPPYLTGSIDIGVRILPVHRLFVIGAGLVVALGLWGLVQHSRFGVHLRASVDNEGAASALGIDTSRIYSTAFLLGAGLAALGGIVGAELMPMEANYPLRYLVVVLLVVAVGGMGSITGALVASLALGIIDTAGRYFVPDYGAIWFYVIIMAVLAVRPNGLLGLRAGA